MRIRPAQPLDAEAACALLRASITTLCGADHRNDPALLQPWLANKTPATVRTWITAPDQTILLAETADRLLGLGGFGDAGKITLNYIAPESRFQGVSTAMLGALEARLRQRGITQSRLASTLTAHRFYQRRGYRDLGQSVAMGDMIDYHMSKQL